MERRKEHEGSVSPPRSEATMGVMVLYTVMSTVRSSV